MAYNTELRTKKLNKITYELFQKAIFLSYRDGITTMAPLGFSGDDIVIYGESGEGGRKSIVSIRNYCGSAELLITDNKGNFLFYGRYDIRLGIEFLCKQYFKIFQLVKDEINGELPEKEDFAKVKLNDNCTLSEGFEMMKAYQEKLKANEKD